MFRGLRYINIYYLLFPNKTFEYYNWGYSGNIFSLRASTAGFAIVLGIVLFMINMYMNSKTYYTGKQNIIETAISVIMEAFMRLLGRMPVSCKEIYKILISQKVMIILMLIYAILNVKYIIEANFKIECFGASMILQNITNKSLSKINLISFLIFVGGLIVTYLILIAKESKEENKKETSKLFIFIAIISVLAGIILPNNSYIDMN